ncbi:D-2-hydroxyacid dehydrogenase [Limosilactobacillus secaliphilus]|uniref:D-lactate dehydrogenase n=1 Tax=Limosilactobacillus secaliphilus TaxID=396268 RepID=A0A0R2IA18_9LACO|nr:D-2-hydroxyacid dehydrogenase [Limosilactobacillus secaliphilus]KRN58951.1 D-lactate dehydrogenase [Limosilactobacillus secaliphilus]
MTKILMTSVRPDEQAAIDNFAKEHQVDIVTTPKPFLDDDVVNMTKDVDGLVIQQHAAVPDAALKQVAANGLKQIATRTAGVDTINLDLAHQLGLKVTNVPAYSPRSVAEFALMQIFRLLRKTYSFDHRVAQDDFRWAGLQAMEIHSATIGIIGVGRIGGTLAKLLHALNAHVLGFDVKPRTDMDGIVEYVSKEELLKRSDVVSLHVDLNPTSKGLLSEPDFKLMKKTAGLVNASRGPVVVTKDLVAALQNHELAAAALDTVEGEEHVFNKDLTSKGLDDLPLVKQLHDMDNVILTPHIAFFTNIAVQNMVDISLTDVMTILAGKQSDHEL